MGENEELTERVVYYGRWMPEDFVTRNHNINGIIYYLRAERDFEIFKLTSFVTTNLISFEKIKDSRFRSRPSLPSEKMGEPFHADHPE